MKDQVNKADNGKLRMALLFRDLWGPLSQVAAVLSYGAQKYEDRGWKKVEPDRYWDAFYRHLSDFHGGEEADKESGLHHLAHAVCNLLFLLYFYTVEEFIWWTKFNKPPQEHKNVSDSSQEDVPKNEVSYGNLIPASKIAEYPYSSADFQGR